MENSAVAKMLVAGQKDLAWYEGNLNRLIAKYNNKFIAFRSCSVIEADQDLDSLMKSLKSRKINTSNVLIRFVSKVKSIL